MKKVLIIALIAASAAAGTFAQQQGIKGYLVDVLCGQAGYPEGYQGKIDLTVNPEKNVVACLTMDNCVATGFGLYVKGSSGKYAFHPFDKASSDLVKKQIVAKLTNKAAPAPFIEVNGTASGTGIISGVTKAATAKASAPAVPEGTKSTGMSGHTM
ncbi:MAG: hypothetical protein WCT14_01755 [Treponemataceae bacterium]